MSSDYLALNPVPIKHVFDASLDDKPELRTVAEKAAQCLDRESENESDTTVTWSAKRRVISSWSLTEKGNSPVHKTELGPIEVLLVDNNLNVGHRAYLSLKDLDEDNIRYTLLRMWGHFLMRRTSKLHQLVFNTDEPGPNQ